MIWPEIWPWVLLAVLYLHRKRRYGSFEYESHVWNRAHTLSCRCLDCREAWESRAAEPSGWLPLRSSSGGRLRVRSRDPGNIP